MDDNVRETVIENAKEDKMSCAVALGLAKKLKVPPKKIGDILNEEKIKVIQCQLGCFK